MKYIFALIFVSSVVAGFTRVMLENEIGARPAWFCGVLAGAIVGMLMHICVVHNEKQ